MTASLSIRLQIPFAGTLSVLSKSDGVLYVLIRSNGVKGESRKKHGPPPLWLPGCVVKKFSSSAGRQTRDFFFWSVGKMLNTDCLQALLCRPPKFSETETMLPLYCHQESKWCFILIHTNASSDVQHSIVDPNGHNVELSEKVTNVLTCIYNPLS